MHRRERLIFTSLLSLGLLAACSDRPAGLPYAQAPKFQLVQLESAAVPVIPTEQGNPAQTGSLLINIQEFLSRFRRILAVPAGVNKVVVTVTAADGTVFSQTLDLAALQSGQTSVTFNGLVPGEAIILIEALDASNKVIRSSRDVAVVAPAATTQKEMGLPGADGGPLLPHGSGGGGSSGPLPSPSASIAVPGAELTADVSVFDGADMKVPTVVVEGYMVRAVAPDSQGNPWTVVERQALPGEQAGLHVDLMKFAPSGAVLVNVPANLPTGILVDSQDNVWTLQDKFVAKWKSDGTLIKEIGLTLPGYTTGMLIDNADRVWVTTTDDELIQISNQGTIVDRKTFAVTQMALDPRSGVVWFYRRHASEPQSSVLIKMMPDGTLTEIVLPEPVPAVNQAWWYASLDIDPTGSVRLVQGWSKRIVQVAPDGTIQVRSDLPTANGVVTDALGRLWLYRLYATPTIYEDRLYRYDGTAFSPEFYRLVSSVATKDRQGNFWLPDRSSRKLSKWTL